MVPFDDTDGMGPVKANDFALTDVGEVDRSPELLASKENAFIGSAMLSSPLPPTQYTLPFQYDGEPQKWVNTAGISCTILGSELVHAGC